MEGKSHICEKTVTDTPETRPHADTSIEKTQSAWPAFLAAHDALVRHIEERLRAADLPDLSWYDVLWVLARVPEQRLRMHELADATVIARSNLTRLIDRMEKAGLVARERVAEDRRGAYARLTEAGADMRRRIWQVYEPAINEVFSQHLSEEENTVLRRLMLRLLRRAQAQQTSSQRKPQGTG